MPVGETLPLNHGTDGHGVAREVKRRLKVRCIVGRGRNW